ncbi:unnamed protein product [Penicillium camemberti]|uniref:Str. FM013 n=1 Tax=Penicillium camemberti (strain FM 013) TaxID=1429867 RepID=A0A0G4PSZ9_PENC3|nr:unnamed protein product [Penicillium camemberti]
MFGLANGEGLKPAHQTEPWLTILNQIVVFFDCNDAHRELSWKAHSNAYYEQH